MYFKLFSLNCFLVLFIYSTNVWAVVVGETKFTSPYRFKSKLIKGSLSPAKLNTDLKLYYRNAKGFYILVKGTVKVLKVKGHYVFGSIRGTDPILTSKVRRSFVLVGIPASQETFKATAMVAGNKKSMLLLTLEKNSKVNSSQLVAILKGDGKQVSSALLGIFKVSAIKEHLVSLRLYYAMNPKYRTFLRVGKKVKLHFSAMESDLVAPKLQLLGDFSTSSLEVAHFDYEGGETAEGELLGSLVNPLMMGARLTVYPLMFLGENSLYPMFGIRALFSTGKEAEIEITHQHYEVLVRYNLGLSFNFQSSTLLAVSLRDQLTIKTPLEFDYQFVNLTFDQSFWIYQLLQLGANFCYPILKTVKPPELNNKQIKVSSLTGMAEETTSNLEAAKMAEPVVKGSAWQVYLAFLWKVVQIEFYYGHTYRSYTEENPFNNETYEGKAEKTDIGTRLGVSF